MTVTTPTGTTPPRGQRSLRVLRWRAFTLVELIVTLVIIAVLVGVAAVAYNSAIKHSYDVATAVSLRQMHKQAAGTADMARVPLTLQAYADVAHEVPALGNWDHPKHATTVLDYTTPIATLGQVQVAVKDTSSVAYTAGASDTLGAFTVDMAAWSPSGRCVLLHAVGHNAETKVVDRPCGVDGGLLAPPTPTGLRVWVDADGGHLKWDTYQPVDIYKNGVWQGAYTGTQWDDPTGVPTDTYTAVPRIPGADPSAPAPYGSGISVPSTGPFTPSTGATNISWNPADSSGNPVNIYRDGTFIGSGSDGVFTDPHPTADASYTVVPLIMGGTEGTAIKAIPSSTPAPPTPAPADGGSGSSGTGPQLVVEGDTVHIAWNPVANTPTAPLTGYRLYRAKSGTSNWTTTNRMWTGTATTTDDKPGQLDTVAWCYRVSAYGPGGESGLSEEACTVPAGATGSTGGSSAPAGYLYAVGDGRSAQLGTGGTGSRASYGTTATTGALAGKQIAQVASGYQHSCALATDGTVACWGDNTHGQIGDGTTADYVNDFTVTPTAITPGALAGKTVTQVVAGYGHTCALASDGTVACWGDGGSGQNGTPGVGGATPTAITPGDLAGKTVVQISAGANFTCALTADGLVACWGSNERGQNGDGTTVENYLPTLVASGALAGKTVTQISAGESHACAVASDNTTACWGNNSDGQLGDGSVTERHTPVVVTPGALAGKTVTQLALGSRHTCALTVDGTVACWGYGYNGQLGDGTGARHLTPTAITRGALAGKTVTQVVAGYLHTCALATDSTLACWGANDYGQLGNGTVAGAFAPKVLSPTAASTLPSALAGKTALFVVSGPRSNSTFVVGH